MSSDKIEPQNNQNLIFSKDAIATKTQNPYVLDDGRVTGYNLLNKDQWLIRTSSQLGALTIDFRQGDRVDSVRFVLTDNGWISDGDDPDAKISTDPKIALQYASQLMTLLQEYPLLEGLKQVYPSPNLSTQETFYNRYRMNYSSQQELEPGEPSSNQSFKKV